MNGIDTPLLDVERINVHFRTETGELHAVRDVTFRMGRERVAIVGESGSGKSTLVRALLGLLSEQARVSAAQAWFRGSGERVDLLRLHGKALRNIRGRHIGMIVQDPKQGLNPVRRVGSQIAEMIRLHRPGLRGAAVRKRVVELLADVNIDDPQRVVKLYPHQISGGMAQRAMIAMMMAGQPDLLIADEATSALDMIVQQRILDVIDDQIRSRGMGLLLISHDIDLVSRYADRIIVMYQGRVMEELSGRNMLDLATHPYTKGLLACRPQSQEVGTLLKTLDRDPAWLT